MGGVEKVNLSKEGHFIKEDRKARWDDAAVR